MSFNETFQDRAARAVAAKNKALEKLRNKPPIDPQVLADRQAAHQRREAAAAEKIAAKQAAEQAAREAAEQAKADAIAAAEAAEEARKAPLPKFQTEAERKAARDARYAARKARK